MPTPAPRVIAIAVAGPLTREDLPGLAERVSALLDVCDARAVLCDVRDLPADAVTVDALARLQLAACRHRARVRLRNASAELRELLALMGLDDILPE